MTKSIEFKITLEGNGVVQYDGNDKDLGSKNSKSGIFGFQKYNNINYAKGDFEATGEVGENGKPIIKKILKISADGLRHAIHVNSMFAHAPNIFLSSKSRLHFFASLDALLRGYLSVTTNERKSSAYALSSAQDRDAVTALELFSNSSAKISGTSDDVSDTSLFFRETTGKTKYESTGYLDIDSLRFISVSDIFGRRAVADDSVDTFRRILSKNIGSEVDEAKYWRRGNSIDIPERGIILTDEQVHKLVVYLFTLMSEMNIVKSQSGYAKTSKIEIKPIGIPTRDFSNGYVSLFKENVFDESIIPSEYHNSWIEIQKDVALAEIAAVEAELEKSRAEAKARKAFESLERKKNKKTVSDEQSKVEE